MTIAVDVKPEVQAELGRKAAACGVDVQSYVATPIEQAAQPETVRPKYRRPAWRSCLPSRPLPDSASISADLKISVGTSNCEFPGAALPHRLSPAGRNYVAQGCACY